MLPSPAVRVSTSGDDALAGYFVPIALQELGRLENLHNIAGVSSFSRTMRLTPEVTAFITVASGAASVHVAANPTANVLEEPVVEVPVPPLLSGFVCSLRDADGEFPPDEYFQGYTVSKPAATTQPPQRIYNALYDKYSKALAHYGVTEGGRPWYSEGMFGGDVDWQNGRGDVLTWRGPNSRYFYGTSVAFDKKLWYKGIEFVSLASLSETKLIGASIVEGSNSKRHLLVAMRTAGSSVLKVYTALMPKELIVGGLATKIEYEQELDFSLVATLTTDVFGDDFELVSAGTWQCMFFDRSGRNGTMLVDTVKTDPSTLRVFELDFEFNPDTGIGAFSAEPAERAEGSDFGDWTVGDRDTSYEPAAEPDYGTASTGRDAGSRTQTIVETESFTTIDSFTVLAVDWDEFGNKRRLYRQYYSRGDYSVVYESTSSWGALPGSGSGFLGSSTVATTAATFVTRTMLGNYVRGDRITIDPYAHTGGVFIDDWARTQYTNNYASRREGGMLYALFYDAGEDAYRWNGTPVYWRAGSGSADQSENDVEVETTSDRYILWADLRHNVLVTLDIQDVETTTIDITGDGVLEAAPVGTQVTSSYNGGNSYPYNGDLGGNPFGTLDFGQAASTATGTNGWAHHHETLLRIRTSGAVSSTLTIWQNDTAVHSWDVIDDITAGAPTTLNDAETYGTTSPYVDGVWARAWGGTVATEFDPNTPGLEDYLATITAPGGSSTSWRSDIRGVLGYSSGYDWTWSYAELDSQAYDYSFAIRIDPNEKRSHLAASFISSVEDKELRATIIDAETGTVLLNEIATPFGIPTPQKAPLYPISVV